jgi:hypothetical protein
MMRGSLLLSSVALLAACNHGSQSSAERSAAPPASAVTGQVAPSGSAVRLGEPISAQEVSLADVARDPAHFTGRPFTTHGTVTSVCQEMGCWMEIKDAATGAHLRMHGHSFFVPKSSVGRRARVQATLVPSNAPKACADEAECAPKDLALLQLDATGVELD